MPVWRRVIGVGVAGVIAAAGSGCGGAAGRESGAGTGTRLQGVYEAAFDVFLPARCVRRDAGLAEAAVRLKAQGWAAAVGNPGFLEGLGRMEGLAERRGKKFEAMGVGEREEFLVGLQGSADAGERFLAQGLRARYLGMIYGSPVGLRIAGLAMPEVVAGDATAQGEALRRTLPASRLRYDAARGVVEHAEGAVDVVIVGSGPGGAVLAHELRRGGKRVVLVERGPLVAPGAVDGRSMAWLMESGGERTSADGGVWFRNGQAVGGGTTVNVDLAFAPTLPMVRSRIEAWRREGRIAAGQFSEEEVGAAYGWVKAAIGTREVGMGEVNANNRILWEGAQRDGMTPALYGLNTFAAGQGSGGITDKRSAVEGLILDAMEDRANPLSLLPDAKAVRMVWEDGRRGGEKRAAGVEVEMQRGWGQAGLVEDVNGLKIQAGARVRIKAKQVILCAGTLGTAALLLNSGVENGNVGRGIVAHPSMPLIGVFDREIKAWEGTASSVYVGDRALSEGYVLESTSALPAYVAGVTPGDGQRVFEVIKNFAHLGGFGVMLIDTPSAENRIRVDARGEPVIEYTLSAGDKVRFGKAVAEGVRVMFRGGAREVILPTREDVLGEGKGGERRGVVLTRIEQAELVERNLRFVPGETVVTSAHLQGSAKMGASAEGSVVSQEQRVWGCENVFVVDSSVFPTSIGANPMQSVYTLAKVFADHWERMGR